MASEIPFLEGDLEFNPPSAGKPCKTWYTVFGTLTTGDRPLICLHGGPGIPHNYMIPIKHLVTTHGVPVIMYDQLGCGNSTRLPEKSGNESFWTVDLFLSELENLITRLEIQNYDILGQSWGGMLAACHAIRQPKGLNRLIIANSPASMALWVQAAGKLRRALPEGTQNVLLKHEKDGTTESREYEDALQVYYERYVCRLKPWPEELLASFTLLKADMTVYLTMNGPSEFSISGALKTWSVVDEIHNINVPTLLINGKYDEAQDEVMEPFFKSIPEARWERFSQSSHLPQFEENEKFLDVVGNFLRPRAEMCVLGRKRGYLGI